VESFSRECENYNCFAVHFSQKEYLSQVLLRTVLEVIITWEARVVIRLNGGSIFVAFCVAVLVIAGGPWTLGAASHEVDALAFNRDIRPILSNKCFTCHGPDESKRLSALRLDTEKGILADLGGRFAVVPSKPAESELIRRITSHDATRRMPPTYSGKKLSRSEIELLQRWVSDGAKWQQHWSFLTPQRPRVPKVTAPKRWAKNAIDYFVLEGLSKEGLVSSPRADLTTLLRRVSLDLTGLPPTPAELDTFLADKSPNAYEKVVDSLLASPSYGERMAIRWLDAARYADTNGYQTDAERYMWRWRDWVIDAFNSNMSFDRFTIEQIAGDMLPEATLDQKIASAFNRNHRGNGEGGIIDAEYAVEYVVDRVETTSTVWMGLTLGCARCHDHKYDPFTQKEFYSLFAFFNNIPERGKAFKYGNSPPMIKAPTRKQQVSLRELDDKLEATETKFSELLGKSHKAQREWEKAVLNWPAADWSLRGGLEVHYPLDDDPSGQAPRSGRVGSAFIDGLPRFVDGEIGGAASFDGKVFIEAGDVANYSLDDKFTLSAWIYPTAADGAIVTRTSGASLRMVSGEISGYGIYLKDGKVQFNMLVRVLDDGVSVETTDRLELNKRHYIAATYDGSRFAEGVAIYVNGQRQKLKVNLDEMNQHFSVNDPLRIGASAGPGPRFRGSIDDVRVYNRALEPAEVAILATSDSLKVIAARAVSERTQAENDKLRLAFLDRYAPLKIRKIWHKLVALREERTVLLDSFPTLMVMQEMEQPRATHLLVRGAYDKPGTRVRAGVPHVISTEGSQPEPRNRLEFAKWLVNPLNPLTARVTVNRFWQMLFGVGLVKTAEDFGSQGDWPRHMDLLDWLAVDFVESGWDVKGVMKTIVMSATYQQASKIENGLYERDPENRLLARGSRFRLPAEVVRDQALAISGLLVERIGGPSVKPYQPAGLWAELDGGAQGYVQGDGNDLYRRSLYTFWKRAVPPPTMMNFDSAGREACVVRENRTNTPLQALNLMNDVTFVEASRKMAERMMLEGGVTPAERVSYGYRLATAREPDSPRKEILVNAYQYNLDNYKTNRKAALSLVAQGDSNREAVLDLPELASYTMVANLILNLDEVITKE
jgi:hypothetical protein